MVGAIVIGGHFQGLGLIRSLGERKIDTYLIDEKRCLAKYSKYCKKHFIAKNTYDEKELIELLISISVKYPYTHGWLLLPTDDFHVSLLSRNKEILNKIFTIIVIDPRSLKYCENKKKTHDLCKTLGIDTPRTIVLDKKGDINDIANIIDYPVIIKPSIKHNFYPKTKTQFIISNNKNELIDNFNYALNYIPIDQIMIQEYITCTPGDNVEIGIYYDSYIKHSISIKKIRQIPMMGGTGTSYYTIHPESKLIESCEKILASINYFGICDIEFIKDNNSNSYKLIDINPRSFKWLYLSTLLGTNYPHIMFNKIFYNKNDTSFSQQIGDNYIFIDELLDLYISIKLIINRKLSIADYYRSLKGNRLYGVASVSDPFPFVMQLVLSPLLLIKGKRL